MGRSSAGQDAEAAGEGDSDAARPYLGGGACARLKAAPERPCGEVSGTMKSRWNAGWLLVLALMAFGLKEGDSVTSVGLQCLCLLPGHDMNCSWTAPDVDSAYVLVYQSLKLRPHENHTVQVQRGHNWLVIARSQLVLGESYSVWLEVCRASGVETSEKLHFSLEEIAKPPAPELEPVAVSSSGATVRWKNPSLSEDNTHQSLVCELRYKASRDAAWTCLGAEHVSQEDHELEDLEPFTWYEVQTRCALEDGQGFWSEWSSSRTFRSPEAAPLGQVDVWRKIHLSENLEPTLHLVWKALSPEEARGDILKYIVDFWDRRKTVIDRSACLCYSVPIPAAAGYAQVSACNSVGETQPATLSLEQTDLPAPRGVQVWTAQSPGLNVTWTFSPSLGGAQPLHFVVEWQGEISRELLGWIRQPVDSRSALLTGDFRPKEPYLVRVYAVYARGSNALAPVRAYVQEGVPSTGPPAVQDQSVSSTVSLISWEEIPLANRHGHLTHYTIYLKLPGSVEPEVHGPLEAEGRNYTLEGLKPGSSYQLWMTGSTSAGEGPPSSVHEFHTSGAHWKVYLAALLSGGYLLLLAAVVGFLKREWFLSFFRKVLPSWCWERVPDAGHSLAVTQMDSPSEALTKESLHLPISAEPPEEEPEILQVTEPEPPRTIIPAQRVAFSDYEKHFLPTREELLRLT